MNFFSVAYARGFIARHVLCAVRHHDGMTCLISPLMLSTSAFIYFKECKDEEASCTMGTGPFPGGKARPGRDTDPSPPSSAVVKKGSAMVKKE